MSRYDASTGQGADLETELYYSSSRGKFQRLLELIEQGRHDSILELGLSRFSLMIKQARPDLEVAALNLALQFEDECREAGVRLAVADLLSPPIPFPDCSFDVVLYSEVIEHLQGNPRVPMAEIFRVLRPGGRVLLTTPNLARLTNRLRLLFGRSPLERIGGPGWGGHLREYVLPEITDFVRQAGFHIELEEHSMYWDSIEVYLAAGKRGRDQDGRFYYHPRFTGWRRLVALPLVHAAHHLVRWIPSLRYGMVVVGRRPEVELPGRPAS